MLLAQSALQAQTGEIRGTMYDKEKGEPLIYTRVILVGTNTGAISDVNGYYSISKVKPGTYTLRSTSIGYDTFEVSVTVRVDEILTQNIYLNPSSLQLKEVRISKDKTQSESRVGISKVEVTPREIKVMPSIGGEADIAQYLQILPGVISTGDQGGQLYIRGGSPIQNKVILDGMTIYNPFHSIGLFSVFDVDIIRNVQVYTGGFDATYGGRISAIMDITTRDGDKGGLSGSISTSPFASKVMLEGPLKKFKEEKGGSSFIFSGRTSYLEQSSPVFYPYIKTGLPYNFTDLYGKLSFYAPGGTKVSFFGFNFRDNVNFSDISHFGWNSYGVGSKLVMIPNASSTVIEGNFAYSNYEAEQKESDDKPRYSQINGFEAGLDFSYFQGKDLLRYGFDVTGFKTDFQFFNASNRKIQQQDFTTEIAGYVMYNKVIGRLVIDPSFRIQYYASLQEASPEPRLGLKFVLTDFMRLKAAAGLYSQNLLSAQSDKDVVNLFYGFLSGPDEIPDEFDGHEVNTRLQKARHLVGGIEFDLSKSTTFQVETYLKNFNQLTNINRNKIFDNTAEFADKPANLKEDYIIETGDAYGIDFQLNYDKDPFYVWITYSLAKVTRYDGQITYYPHWDRRHNVNFLAAYTFGKKKSWEASVRWNYGSGFPFTKTQGFYELLNFQQGLNTDYTSNNGTLGILYSDINGGRLSDYHRMDVSLKKTVKFKKDRELKITASVTNVYNRQNVFYFDRVRYERVNQLPILPSVGLNYTF